MIMPSPSQQRAPRKRAAFTLIELLIVMTIIGALVTLAVPATQRLMAKSKAAHCLGNLRNLGAALNLYLSENNNTLPTMVILRSSKDDSQPAMDTTLNQYTQSDTVFHCLADNKQLWQTTGSSYLWNSLLNGQNVASMNFMGLTSDGSRIPVMSDKEDFHQYQDVKVNILYADGHAAKDIQFTTAGGN
jgi:prepilin-type N-terminal cleavage/methylation domain-containing protein/prepilin-type processing-associated H-X9-DG protein